MSVQVVLSLDHWNAGLAGFCGGEPLLMPRVDRLAAESAVFDRHFSLSPAGDASVNGRAWAGGGWGTGPIADPAAQQFGRAGVAVAIPSRPHHRRPVFIDDNMILDKESNAVQ